MIVDFTQDPNGPFGSGNFRDESGKIFYLHDPETAQQFVKTMPGAQLAGKVKGESDDIADQQMAGGKGLAGKVGLESDMIARQALGGAPQRMPDQRLASNMTDAFEGVAGTSASDAKIDAPPAPPQGSTLAGNPLAMPGTPPAASPLAGVQSVGPVVAESDPNAKAVVQGFLSGKLPGAPAAPAAAPGGAAPAASAPETPQATVSPQEAVATYLKGLGAGRAKNQTVTTNTTAFGRPDDAVDAELARSRTAQDATNTALRANAAASDERTEKGIEAERAGLGRASWSDLDAYNRGNKEQAEAKAAVARLNQAYAANEKTLDPDRYVKGMSTGKKIAMVILAAFNGAFGALAGKKNNDVLDILNAEIERDIDAQKNQIAGKRNLLSNQIADFMRQGHDAKTSVDLARDRMRTNTIAVAKLEREQLASQGKDTSQADLLIAQMEEQRTAGMNAAIKEKDDRQQQSEQTTAGTQQGGGIDDALKAIQLTNAITDQQDAATVNKIIDPTGKTQLSPERVKELKAAVRETGGSVGETSAAIESTGQLIADLGGHLDPNTGQITWPQGGLKGVGPIDSRPSGSLLGVPVVGPVLAAGSKIGRGLGLIRTDYDKAKDAQRAVGERVTNMITGANSNLRQDETFRNMLGSDFENEEQTKQNLTAWVGTLFSQRNGQLARLGPDGQRYYFHNLQAAESGASQPGGTAPPLVRHGQAPPAAAPAPAAQPGGAPAPAMAPAGGSTELPKAPGPSLTTGFRPGTYQRLRESRPSGRP